MFRSAYQVGWEFEAIVIVTFLALPITLQWQINCFASLLLITVTHSDTVFFSASIVE